MKDKNKTRRNEILTKVKDIPVIGTNFRTSFSKLDRQDAMTGDGCGALGKRIGDILFAAGIAPGTQTFPNKVNDVDHLVDTSSPTGTCSSRTTRRLTRKLPASQKSGSRS